ncbi:hypothetical protein KEM56_001027 [Ascosphaera pollenicola]|nr:hypothetical protein KEM56_001027 [Ascosphaera pollenicola]
MDSNTNQKPSSSSSSSHYTVFIRLPFERREFVDPPPVDWNAAKDNALWKVLSRPTGQDIDWKALADHFNVSLPFLLQQAAWLYDRQLSQVRAQVRRVGTKSSLRPASSGSVARSASGGEHLHARFSGQSLAILSDSDSDCLFTTENPRSSTTDQENLTLSKAGANTGGVPATLRRHASGGSAGSLLRNATANRAVESRSSVRPVTPAGLYERQGNAAAAAAPPAAGPSQQQQQVPPPPPPLLETRPSFLDAASSDLDEEESTESPSDLDKNGVSTTTKTYSHRRGIGNFRRFGMLSQSKPSLIAYSSIDHYALGDDDDDEEGGALPSFLPLSEETDEEGHTDEPLSSSSANHYDDPNATILGSPEHRYAAAAAAAAGRSSGLGGGMEIDTAITSHQPSTSTTTSTSISTSNSNSVSTIPDLSAADSTGSGSGSIGMIEGRRGAAAGAAATAAGAASNSRVEGLLASPQTGHARDRDREDVSASMSPRSRTRVLAREETDSTASTGSSFSDLDDASVTRSALEEAYLSNEQNGGIASRVSHAFRSRYLSRQ